MKVRCCKYLFSVFLAIIFTTLAHGTLATDEYNGSPQDKHGRFLSMFEIINFPNDACKGDSKNGTCYSSAECDDKGGTKDGDCAQGYGVCCTFSVECGDTVTQNNTYFSKPSSFNSGNCAVQVCPGDDICQLRLDFNSFSINGPYKTTVEADTTDLTKTVLHQYGLVNKNGIAVMPQEGQCTKDSFTVNTPSGMSPPVICGDNNSEHIYVDASSGFCNSLNMVIDPTSSDSSWNIAITTYECGYVNLAPKGCLQYFYGNNDGKFRTFNWSNGYHLANQNQNICFRRESGKSKICYYADETSTDFSISNKGAAATPNSKMAWVGGTTANAGCCGYGDDGKFNAGDGGGYDCLQIPAATTGDGRCVQVNAQCVEGYFCGRVGLQATGSQDTDNANSKKTVCSKRTPFTVRFISDSAELAVEEVANTITESKSYGTKGFELNYMLA